MCGKVFFEESITETTIDIKSMNYVLILSINIDVLHVLTRYMYIFIMEKNVCLQRVYQNVNLLNK